MVTLIIFGLLLFGGEHNTRLVFETNKDQAPADVRYLLQTDKYQLDFKSGEMVFQFGSRSLRIRFAGPLYRSVPTGNARLDRVVRYIDSDSTSNRPGVPKFASVKYESLYFGIDLACHGHAGQLECDFVAMPGADAEQIRVAVDGADGIGIDETGALTFEVADRTFRIHKPNAFQLDRGRRSMVDVRYEFKDAGEIGLAIGQYNRSVPLIISPNRFE
jgi:hypothetical protein